MLSTGICFAISLFPVAYQSLEATFWPKCEAKCNKKKPQLPLVNFDLMHSSKYYVKFRFNGDVLSLKRQKFSPGHNKDFIAEQCVAADWTKNI